MRYNVANNSRGSKFCLARSRSRSFSFARRSSSTSLPSSTKKPPFEFVILDRSYSKYDPRRESRCNGFGAVGAVGDLDVAGISSNGRLL